MTMYTGLARVARKTGYPVVEVAGWKTRGHGQMGEIKSIICHHTASANSGNAPALSYITSNKGALPGPLAQYVLGRDGTVYVVAAGLCWHAGKVGNPAHGNTNALGIEAENDGRGERWSPAQYDSYVKLCAALCREFKLPPSAVRGHKEIAIPRGRKIDPTFDMDAFRSYVAKGCYLDEPADTAVTKPAGSIKPIKHPTGAVKPEDRSGAWPEEPLRITDWHTVESDAAWRELLAAVGYKDRDLGKNLQSWLNDLTDPRTGRPYYDFRRFKHDGIMGVEGVKALQRKLYDTDDDSGKRLYSGAADGDRGPRTVRAEIGYLNLNENRGV